MLYFCVFVVTRTALKVTDAMYLADWLPRSTQVLLYRQSIMWSLTSISPNNIDSGRFAQLFKRKAERDG